MAQQRQPLLLALSLQVGSEPHIHLLCLYAAKLCTFCAPVVFAGWYVEHDKRSFLEHHHVWSSPAAGEPSNGALQPGRALLEAAELAAAAAKGDAVCCRRYMPAELLMEGKMTKAADVYSFAMLMHELLTGQQLFEGMRQSQVSLPFHHAPIDVGPVVRA